MSTRLIMSRGLTWILYNAKVARAASKALCLHRLWGLTYIQRAGHLLLERCGCRRLQAATCGCPLQQKNFTPVSLAAAGRVLECGDARLMAREGYGSAVGPYKMTWRSRRPSGLREWRRCVGAGGGGQRCSPIEAPAKDWNRETRPH